MPNTNTDKNVYILGAGFSKELGLPLQDDFLLVAKEVYFKDPKRFSHFGRVFEYQDKMCKMRKFLNYPLLNLEHLFNLIEMDAFYSKSKSITKIKNDFTKLICDVLIAQTPCPFVYSNGRVVHEKKFDLYCNFLNLFVKDTHHNLETQDSIISFNYDLTIEAAAWIANWKISEGHEIKVVKNELFKLDTGIVETDKIEVKQIGGYFGSLFNSIFPNTLPIFSNENNSLKLLKLHGSINWNRKITSSNGQTFIVPPTWNKSDPQVRKLWDMAYKEIFEAKRIIIIGYSFPETDIYVKSLLALALNENKILQKIIFVNPDENSTKNASLSLLDKHFEKYCEYKPWTLSRFIKEADFILRSLNRKCISFY